MLRGSASGLRDRKHFYALLAPSERPTALHCREREPGAPVAAAEVQRGREREGEPASELDRGANRRTRTRSRLLVYEQSILQANLSDRPGRQYVMTHRDGPLRRS